MRIRTKAEILADLQSAMRSRNWLAVELEAGMLAAVSIKEARRV